MARSESDFGVLPGGFHGEQDEACFLCRLSDYTRVDRHRPRRAFAAGHGEGLEEDCSDSVSEECARGCYAASFRYWTKGLSSRNHEYNNMAIDCSWEIQGARNGRECLERTRFAASREKDHSSHQEQEDQIHGPVQIRTGNSNN